MRRSVTPAHHLEARCPQENPYVDKHQARHIIPPEHITYLPLPAVHPRHVPCLNDPSTVP
jgi:hypothetical protein